MALSLGQGIAALGEDGSLAGTAMVTPFGETATISLVIVEASLRGRGLGRRLMRAALALCGDRAVRLIATRDGLPLYETLGFRATHEIRQHQGPLLLPDAPAPDAGLGWATQAARVDGPSVRVVSNRPSSVLSPWVTTSTRARASSSTKSADSK